MGDFFLKLIKPNAITLTQTNLVVVEPEIDLKQLNAMLENILGV